MSDNMIYLRRQWANERHNQIKREYKKGVPIEELYERFTKKVVQCALRGVK